MEIKKESWASNTYIRQNIVKNKDCNKRQRRALHNNKGINPTRGYNTYKYLCTQRRSTQIHKVNINRYKRSY